MCHSSPFFNDLKLTAVEIMGIIALLMTSTSFLWLIVWVCVKGGWIPLVSFVISVVFLISIARAQIYIFSYTKRDPLRPQA